MFILPTHGWGSSSGDRVVFLPVNGRVAEDETKGASVWTVAGCHEVQRDAVPVSETHIPVMAYLETNKSPPCSCMILSTAASTDLIAAATVISDASLPASAADPGVGVEPGVTSFIASSVAEPGLEPGVTSSTASSAAQCITTSDLTTVITVATSSVASAASKSSPVEKNSPTLVVDTFRCITVVRSNTTESSSGGPAGVNLRHSVFAFTARPLDGVQSLVVATPTDHPARFQTKIEPSSWSWCDEDKRSGGSLSASSSAASLFFGHRASTGTECSDLAASSSANSLVPLCGARDTSVLDS